MRIQFIMVVTNRRIVILKVFREIARSAESPPPPSPLPPPSSKKQKKRRTRQLLQAASTARGQASWGLGSLQPNCPSTSSRPCASWLAPCPSTASLRNTPAPTRTSSGGWSPACRCTLARSGMETRRRHHRRLLPRLCLWCRRGKVSKEMVDMRISFQDEI